MARIAVRNATACDLASVFALRDSYYANRGEPVQIRECVAWTVCEVNGVIRAVRGVIDGAPGERWQTDLYSDGTRLGTVALGAIMRAGHAQAEADGVRLIGVTAPDNTAIVDLALKHGWRIVGIMIERPLGGS